MARRHANALQAVRLKRGTASVEISTTHASMAFFIVRCETSSPQLRENVSDLRAATKRAYS